jgi:hypothetical protein
MQNDGCPAGHIASSKQELLHSQCCMLHSSEAFVPLKIHADREGAGGDGLHQRLGLFDEVVFDADEQRRITTAEEASGRGQPGHPKALLNQGVDRRIGMGVVGDEN